MQDVMELKDIETMAKILSAGFRLRSVGGAIHPIYCFVITATYKKGKNIKFLRGLKNLYVDK